MDCLSSRQAICHPERSEGSRKRSIGFRQQQSRSRNKIVATRCAFLAREVLRRLTRLRMTDGEQLHLGAAFVARAEVNNLRQRQLAREINRVGLPAHVTLPAITSALPATAGFFLAPKRAADFGATRSRVDTGHAAIAANCADKFFGFAHVVSEDGRGQTLGNAILNPDRVVEVATR